MDIAMPQADVEVRGNSQIALKKAILEHLAYSVGKDADHAVARDWAVALSLAARDRVIDRWMQTTREVYRTDAKRVYYLSMEFLIGRLLSDTLSNLGILETARAALDELGVSYDKIAESEPDAALGNGGLGRLAACFLDSMSNLGIPAYGYGIRYRHGLFRQKIGDGWQLEEAEDWLAQGNPWEFRRPEVRYPIGFGGSVAAAEGDRAVWTPGETVLAAAFDTPVAGWGGHHVNTLRLWSAKPTGGFDLAHFNQGQFLEAAAPEVLAETICRVLYPDDTTPEGQELRLKQEYFFTSASLQDLLRRFVNHHDDLARLPNHAAVQMNDTHPAIAVPELVRLLVDDHGVGFDKALEITRGCLAYTNHTLLPEALERWPRGLVGAILPRHLQLIERIDQGFATVVAKAQPPVDFEAVRILDTGGDAVRMGNLAFVGSHRVNGVSALHTDLMQRTVFHDLNTVLPGRIVNQTNGITPRRWMKVCNPGLSKLVAQAIGDDWVGDLERIEALAPFADDAGFRADFRTVKQENKRRLSDRIVALTGQTVDPDAMFDVQIKRLHEYKRQLMNALEAVAHYQAIQQAPDADWQPRVKVIAGKAFPGYAMAKLIIKLINDVAKVVNADPVVRDRFKIVFLPNYNVSLAEVIIPAAELSEQISTAGMEASGTGNMKFALNGALTIGTLDGANVEIAERVGEDNIFIFGLTADEVAAARAAGHDPRRYIDASPALAGAIEAIASGAFSPDDPDRFRAITDDLTGHDYFMVTADFDAYAAAQRTVDGAYGDQDDWTRRAVLNTAHAGWFSSDRTIRGYARDIWDVPVGAG